MWGYFFISTQLHMTSLKAFKMFMIMVESSMSVKSTVIKRLWAWWGKATRLDPSSYGLKCSRTLTSCGLVGVFA